MGKNHKYLILLGCLSIICACSRSFEIEAPDPTIVSAYTSGVISRESTIRIHFTEDMVSEEQIDKAPAKLLISFKPKIAGQTVWTTPRTLEFQPADSLPSGQEYTAKVSLSRWMEQAEDFGFRFSIIQQSFSIDIDGLYTPSGTDLKSPQLRGMVKTADVVDLEQIEKILSARQHEKLSIEWSQAPNRLEHRFIVKGIVREEEATSVQLSWNGNPIKADQTGKRTIEVPPLKSFTITGVKLIQAAEEYILICFSDPLKQKQNLDGFLWVSEFPGLRFVIESNMVRIFSSVKWPTELTLNIEPGIQNSLGRRLAVGKKEKIVFKLIEPQVRIPGKGVILPTSQGLTIPIETINLRGVVVEAMRIYEDNIAQFLQVNTLSGHKELKRTGKVVWRKALSIDWSSENKNQWLRTGLDLTPLVTNHPKGMYRLKVYFRPNQIDYPCPELSDEEKQILASISAEQDVDQEEAESSGWDAWELEYNKYDYYKHRKNPCHPAYFLKYYNHDISAYRNVLVSDIGLIAKKGNDDLLIVAASDLKTAKAFSGVNLTILNYQQQEIGQGVTNQDGIAEIKVKDVPFLVSAEKGGQAGYLKLDEESALSVSHFDAGGVTAEKGIKGFIYGDRGVWRPGDPIYITFILMDKENRLPPEHPIQLRFIDPRGRLVTALTQKESIGSFYHFPLCTEPDALTGIWMVTIAAGGAVFEKPIRIETIMPNRLKIDIDFGPDIKSLTSGEIEAALTSSWLHGAPAKDLEAEVEVSFRSAPTSFSRYGDYVFDDPVRVYETETQSVFKGRLDKVGKSRISASVYTNNVSPGMLTANFTNRVFEPSGVASSDRFSIPFHPFPRYVGIKTPRGDKRRGMLLTDTPHSVDVAILDTNGNPVPRAQVFAELYKIKWRWWWEKGDENLASYVGSSSYRAIQSGNVAIKEGRGTWTFQVKYPSWGRYLIRIKDKEGGHITGKIVYIDWPGWAGKAQAEGPGGASLLSFSADKESYQVGEKATITIPTVKTGRALVVLEAGGKILSSQWIEGEDERSRFEFDITAEMAPNAYAHVTFLQPHMQAGSDMPIRMYGIIPIMVEDPATHLEPVIEAADEFHPEETATITVRESSGNPMTYTLAIVDEGLLGLTRFKTPDPWAHFYRREATMVKTWDLYDFVAAAYGGVLEQLLAIGGGDELESPDNKKAERFPPLVRFLGPFELARGKKKVHLVEIPQYVGAVRIMCVASKEDAFGRAGKEVFVRKPLMVLATLPRVVSIEEEVEVPVSVFVMNEGLEKIKVDIKTEGPVAAVGPVSKFVQFDAVGDKLINFRIKAQSTPGIGRVLIKARAGGEQAAHRIEFDVRIPSEAVSDVYNKELPQKQKWVKKIKFPGVAGTNSAALEVSRIPPLNLNSRLDYLIRYPHGCIEQITSAVFPQLYLNKLIQMDPKREDEIQTNVETGIDRIRRFQNADGGFGFWPGSGQAHEWVSSYAGHFLLEAERLGYVVPADVMSKWKQYQSSKAQSWTAGPEKSELQQAYRLFCLALAGEPQLGGMNRLRERTDLPLVAKWRLAAAYYLAGQTKIAQSMTSAKLTAIPVYHELSGTFGSDLRDKAMVMEAAVIIGHTRKVEDLFREISRELAGERWLSTQTTAYALLSIAKYVGFTGNSGSMDFSYSWNGQPPVTISTEYPIAQRSLSPAEDSLAGTLEIRNTGSITLYPRLTVEGIPPLGQEKAAENGLSLSVKYLDLDLNPIKSDIFELGTDIIAEIQIGNAGKQSAYQDMALSHLVPAGWEINNVRLDDPVLQGSTVEYQDIRDDRIYTYFDLAYGSTKTFRYLLKASYLGSFYLPLIKVEAMYDATINARTPGRWIRVVRPGTQE